MVLVSFVNRPSHSGPARKQGRSFAKPLRMIHLQYAVSFAAADLVERRCSSSADTEFELEVEEVMSSSTSSSY